MPSRKVDGLVVVLFLIALTFELWVIPKYTHIPKVEQQQAQLYTIYLPFAQQTKGVLGSGVAGGSKEQLKAAWNYVYGWCDAPCTPFILHYSDPLPYCPPRLMLWNEPEAPEPYGHTITPTLAAERSRQIRADCPDTLLIAGNNVQAEPTWLDEYIASDGQYDVLGTHCYSYGLAQYCVDLINKFREHFKGAPICVTEWSILLDSWVDPEFAKYRDFLENPWLGIHCSAVYSDKQGGVYPWGPNIDVSLIDSDGNLTERGKIFTRAK